MSQGNTAGSKKFGQSGGHVGMTATDCPWPAVQYNGHWTEALRLSQLTHGTETAAFSMAAPSVPLVPSLLDQAVEYEFGMGISSVTKSTGAL